jgi:7tm Chemosensory receptor
MKIASLFKSKNIFHSIRPFYYLLKVFGLASFELDIDNGRIKHTSSNKISFFLVFSFWLFMALFMIGAVLMGIRYYENTYNSDFLNKIPTIFPLIELSITAYFLFTQHTHQVHIIKFLQYLNNFDKTVKELQSGFEVINSSLYSVFVFSVIFFVIGSISFFQYAIGDTLFTIFFFIFVTLMHLILASQYILAVQSALIRMKILKTVVQ